MPIYFFTYIPLFFSISVQLFTVYLLSSGNVYLTYNGYNVTDHFALIFLFTLFIMLTRFLLARPHVLDLFSKNTVANFFATKFMPGLSLVMSTLTLVIFSGFRKLIFLQNQSLDSTTFWGDIMIHRRYDFQARADYFDKLMSEGGITVPAAERARVLKDSSSMSDIFNNASQIKEDHIAVTEGLTALADIVFIAGSLIVSFLAIRWILGFLGDDGGSRSGSDIGPDDIDAMATKQLELDNRVSKIESFFKGLAETSKDSTLVEMSLDKDPLRFGKVIGVLLDNMSKGLSGHDEALVDTMRLFCNLPPYTPKFKPFSGHGEKLGSALPDSESGSSPFSPDTIKNFIMRKLFGSND